MAVENPRIWGTTSVVTATGVDLDAITMLPNGGYVVAFRQNSKVGFQIYNGNGDKVGGMQFVAAPTTNASGTPLAQWEPSLTTNADGTFVIGWTEPLGTSGGGRILRHQQFDANGNTVVVNNTPVIKTVSSTVLFDGAGITDDGAGGWITAYIQADHHPYIHDVSTNTKGEIKTADGGSLAAAGRMDIARIGAVDYIVSYSTNNGLTFGLFKGGSISATHTINSVEESRVVALKNPDGSPNGKFAVNYRTSTDTIVKIYHVGTNGVFVEDSSVTIMSGALDTTGYKTDIVALRDGGFAVAYKGAGLSDVWVKVFDADGNSKPALQIPLPDYQISPSISELRDGRLAVSWHSCTGTGIIETAIIDARAAKVVGLVGTGGNDIYAPSKHEADDFDGDAGVDTLTFKESTAGVAVNLSTQSGSAGDANNDIYKNFENIIGSRFNDTLTGSAVANKLEGGAGDDTLNGFVGTGTDTLIGGAGNDTYVVSASNTVIDESGGGYDQVYSSFTYTLSAGIENLFATGSDAINLTGNESSNIISGNEAGNRLTGNGGSDTLYGNGGNDVLDGGIGDDYLLGGGGDDTLDGGAGNDALDGGDGNDKIYGQDGIDNLQGGVGNDTLDGGTGNDVLTGGDGFDSLLGGAGDDNLNGNGGADTMDGGAGNDSYVIDDAGDVVNDTGGGLDTVIVTVSYDLNRLTGIENITGVGTSAFTFTGTADSNIMNGSDGINILDGAAGDDTLRGNGGNDTLKGGVGNDWLDGGAGNDTIYGQDGNNVLSGGADKDFFVFDKRPNKSTNVDKILDYNVRDDSIYLENTYFKVGSGSFSKPKQMASKYFYKGAKAHDRDDRIIYDQKKGVLYYDKDGTGSSAAVKIATLSKNLKMTYKDFFVI